jgi:hypothetical protein
MLVGLEKFDASVKAWFGEVRQAAQETAAGLAEVALQEIVEESPQYTGDFVGGWEVGFNAPPRIWRPPKILNQKMIQTGTVEPFQKGDSVAIEYALSKAQPRFAAAKREPLGTSIYLSNSAHHDEDYAWKIENGEIAFRPVNQNADRVVQRGALFVRNRFKHIGAPQLAVLRSLGV